MEKKKGAQLSALFTKKVVPRDLSDAHGHDDVAVAVRLVGERTHLAGGLFVLQLDADRPIGGSGKKIQHVAGIEADGDGIALGFLLDIFFRFAVLRARGGDLDAFFRNREFDGVRTLVGKLRDAAHSVAQFGALDDDALVVVARQYSFVIRELSSENA